MDHHSSLNAFCIRKTTKHNHGAQIRQLSKRKNRDNLFNNSSEKQYSQKYNHINSNVKKAICLKEFLEQDFILFVFIRPHYSVTENTRTIF